MARSKEEAKKFDLLISEKRWEEIRKPLIGLFLTFHFGLILLFFAKGMPVPMAVVHSFRRYFLFTGLAQDYGVFAPSPRQSNVHLMATVIFADGSMRLYPFPRIDRLPLTEKLTKERYRKFLEDNAVWDDTSAWIINDVARFAARQCDVFPHNRPKTVVLIRYVGNVPP